MFAKIVLTIMSLGFVLGFGDAADKGKTKTILDSSIASNRVKTPGELWSDRYHDCWDKYRDQIVKKTKQLGLEVVQIRKQVEAVNFRLIKNDSILNDISQNEKLLSQAEIYSEEKIMERHELFQKRLNRKKHIDSVPELKIGVQRLGEKRKQIRKIKQDILALDKSCSELLLGTQGVAQ